MIHEALYKALKEKYNITQASIEGDEENFVIYANEGQKFTNADFTEAELVSAKENLILEKQQAEAEAAANKAAAEAKLAALGLTAEDLKALGL